MTFASVAHSQGVRASPSLATTKGKRLGECGVLAFVVVSSPGRVAGAVELLLQLQLQLPRSDSSAATTTSHLDSADALMEQREVEKILPAACCIVKCIGGGGVVVAKLC